MKSYAEESADRRDREFDLMNQVVSAATDLVNEVAGRGDLPPSLGAMERLADAVHSHWKFQRGEE